MSTTTYSEILRQVALRIDALTGGQPAAQELIYNNAVFDATSFDSSIFPFTAIKDAILVAEGKLAGVIASVGNHPDRTYLFGVTNTLASGAVLPTTSASGKPILGVYGSIRDSSDHLVCKEKTLEEIERRNRNAGSFYRLPMYAYKIDGNRVYHTRPTITIDVCIWDHADQQTALDAGDPMLLPDYLAEALVCGTLTYLVRDDEFTEQAALYAKYFQDTLEAIKSPGLSMASKSRPGPTMTVTST